MRNNNRSFQKTIGILTFHDGINHGGYLQVYSLVNYIKGSGFNVEVINYKNKRHWFNEYLCVLRTKSPYLFVMMFKKIIVFKKSQSLLPFGSFTFDAHKIDCEKYDIVIVGSDEIWNYQQPIVGFDLTYFGKNIKAKRLISYAASFGAVNEEHGNIPSEISLLLNKFDGISVRDSNSLSIVEKNGRSDAELVVDPVFLIDLPINNARLDEKEFILIYAAGLSVDLQEEIRSYAKKMGKELISVGYMNRWCDKNIIAIDPFTWLAYFKKASYVITSMFHGTMISIKYGKQFCTLVDPYRVNKFIGIMEKLGLNNRIKGEGISVEKIFDSKIDYLQVNKLLDIITEESKNYLQQALYY
jgi:hypothetical protein